MDDSQVVCTSSRLLQVKGAQVKLFLANTDPGIRLSISGFPDADMPARSFHFAKVAHAHVPKLLQSDTHKKRSTAIYTNHDKATIRKAILGAGRGSDLTYPYSAFMDLFHFLLTCTEDAWTSCDLRNVPFAASRARIR